jgi:outer membrane receptor protein involved in Fe transport
LKKFVFGFLFFLFSVGRCAFGGTSGAGKEDFAQVSDSLGEEMVSDTAQMISEENVIEDDQFRKEILGLFSNKDEISFQDIDDSFVRDLGDILETRSLLNVIKLGPPGQPSAVYWGAGRGFRIFIDGILYEQQSLSIPQKGILDLNSIPLENVERVEILPSGTASLWGKGSGLGAINVITKDYKGAEPHSRVTVGRGPDRYRGTQVELGRGVTSRGEIYLTAGFKESNGYLTNSDYEASTLSGKTTLRLKNNLNLRFFVYRHKTKMGLPLFPDVSIQDVRKKEDDWGITGSLFFRQKRNSLLRLDLRSDKGEHEVKSKSSGFEIKKTVRSLSLRAIQTTEWRKRHNLKLEAYGEREKYETSDFQRTGYTDYFSLTDIICLNGKMNFLAFSKIENDDEFKVSLSLSGGISYGIAPDLTLFSTMGRFVDYPSSMDLHWQPVSLSLRDTIPDYREEGNPDLKAQKSTVFDFGADLTKESWKVSCLVFKSKIDDFFNWSNADTSIAYGYWKPANTRADIWGVSLNSVLHFLSHFKSSVSYCFKESRDSDKRLCLPYSPKHSLFGYLQYENEFLKREIGLKLRLEADILSPRFLDEYEKDEESGVAVLNGQVTIRFLDFYLYYVAENMTDRVYRLTPYFPMPRRSWWWGFSWEFFD